jgi:hypothetical protein
VEALNVPGSVEVTTMLIQRDDLGRSYPVYEVHLGALLSVNACPRFPSFLIQGCKCHSASKLMFGWPSLFKTSTGLNAIL